jgi:hypothetical protein
VPCLYGVLSFFEAWTQGHVSLHFCNWQSVHLDVGCPPPPPTTNPLQQRSITQDQFVLSKEFDCYSYSRLGAFTSSCHFLGICQLSMNILVALNKLSTICIVTYVQYSCAPVST